MCNPSCPRREFGEVDEIDELEDDYIEESPEDEIEQILSAELHSDWYQKFDDLNDAWEELRNAVRFMRSARDLLPADCSTLLSQPNMTLKG